MQPVAPQPVAHSPTQSARGSGAAAATSEQVPTAPGFAQVRQAVLQALLQQNPSTQNAVAHSVDRVQACPAGSVGTHAPEALQRLPETHCASLLQPVRQAPPPQAYGAHDVRAPCGAPLTFEQVPRLPATSQALHCAVQVVSQHTPSMQLPLAQSVPLTHPAPGASLTAQVP